MGQVVRHSRHEGDEGRGQHTDDHDRADGGPAARLGPRRPTAHPQRSQQPDPLGPQADEEQGHDDGEKGRRVGEEGDRVAEGGDRHPGQGRPGYAPEIELGRVERNCGQELRSRYQVGKDGLFERPDHGADTTLGRD